MARIAEVVVILAGVGSIATFLGVRAAIRRTLRGLGRHPDEEHGNTVESPPTKEVTP